MKRTAIQIVILAIVFWQSAWTSASSILVYDGGGTGRIQNTMTSLGYSYDVRTATNPVTAADLAAHSLLVVGWNESGNMSGLNPTVLNDGIKGKVLITGHDPDYHAYYNNNANAKQFLSQSISWAAGTQTGMIALADVSTDFSYLPSQWGISASSVSGNTVSSITADGMATSIYAGLTPAAMSGWMDSSHNVLMATWGSQFKAFELGANGSDVITIGGTVPEPCTIGLLSLGAAMLMRRRKA